jgi:hypothetical protein
LDGFGDLQAGAQTRPGHGWGQAWQLT